eukprot:SAG22_NODE_86_length_21440_cov_288.248700_25_plen_59_part_00
MPALGPFAKAAVPAFPAPCRTGRRASKFTEYPSWHWRLLADSRGRRCFLYTAIYIYTT